MATLHFEIGPDAFTTGSPGDITKATVSFGVDGGSLTTLGTYTSSPEAGNDGIREWTAFSVPVTHNPALDYRVEIAYASGGAWDTCHIRRVTLTRDDSTERAAEYPKGKVYNAAQLDGTGLPLAEMGEDDGGFSTGGAMWNACTSTQDAGFARAYWFFSSAPADPCPPASSGWAVGGVRIG